MFTIYLPAVAVLAQEVDDVQSTGTVLDLNWLTVVLGVVLPMITGLVTSRLAHAGLKAVILAALAAIGGLLNELYSVGGNVDLYDWSSGLANALTVFLLAVGLHFGLLKPVGVTGANGVTQTAVPGGLGNRGPAVAVPGSETTGGAHRDAP